MVPENIVPELAAGLGSSLLLGSLSSSVKYAFGKLRNRVINVEKLSPENTSDIFTDIFRGRLDTEYVALANSKDFCDYILSPQVADTINEYFAYILTGRISEQFQESNLFLKKTAYVLKEKTVTDYLVDTFCNNPDFDAAGLDPDTMTAFFEAYFAEFKRHTVKTLSEKEKALVYLANYSTGLHTNVLLETMRELESNIIHMLSLPYAGKNKDFDKTKETYQDILSRKYRRSFVYPIGSFRFSDIYVSPLLTLNQENLYAKNHHWVRTSAVESIFLNSEFENLEFAPSAHGKDSFGYTDWQYIFQNGNIAYIIGGAGYGKTLFLQNIINNYQKLYIPQASEHIVIYGDLKTFYAGGSDEPKSMTAFLADSMKNATLMDVSQLSPDFIDHYLKMGRCIILLDALDEVEEAKRPNLHGTVTAFFKGSNPNNKICITSRDRGFIPLENIDTYTIRPLDTYQVNEYVDRIINQGKFDLENKESFMKQTQKLIDKQFLNSFLVLSLLISIYTAERELPETKLALYQKCFEYIANKREREKTTVKYDWKSFGDLIKDSTFIELASLGYPNNRNIPKDVIIDTLYPIYKKRYGEAYTVGVIEEFLSFCADRTELFVPSGQDNEFKFFHRSFFEYFYAQYIFLRCPGAEEIVAQLMKFAVDSEVFELTVSLLKQKSEQKYQEVIELLLANIQGEFAARKSDFKCLNIMILILPIVDDVAFTDAFVSILVKEKTKVSRSRAIENQNMLAAFITAKEGYRLQFAQAYFNEALLTLLNIYATLRVYKKPEASDSAYMIDSRELEIIELSDSLVSEVYPEAISPSDARWGGRFSYGVGTVPFGNKHFEFEITPMPFYFHIVLDEPCALEKATAILTGPYEAFCQWLETEKIDGRKTGKCKKVKRVIDTIIQGDDTPFLETIQRTVEGSRDFRGYTSILHHYYPA